MNKNKTCWAVAVTNTVLALQKEPLIFKNQTEKHENNNGINFITNPWFSFEIIFVQFTCANILDEMCSK